MCLCVSISISAIEAKRLLFLSYDYWQYISKIELSVPLLARQWEEDKPQEGGNEDTRQQDSQCV